VNALIDEKVAIHVGRSPAEDLEMTHDWTIATAGVLVELGVLAASQKLPSVDVLEPYGPCKDKRALEHSFRHS
jgi:hypothetical protein